MGDMDIYAAPQPLVVEELRVWGEEVGVARSCGIELQALGFEFPRRPLLGNRVNNGRLSLHYSQSWRTELHG